MSKDTVLTPVPFSDLLGKTITWIRNDGNRLEFETSDGYTYVQHHYQDCCESVSIEDICGDLCDIMDKPILLAECVTNRTDPQPLGCEEESYTWTFYKLSTIKGSVTIRWYGESSGYYSEEVDFAVKSTQKR